MRKLCIQLDPDEHGDLLEGLASLGLWLGDPSKHLEDQGQDKIPVWPKAGICDADHDAELQENAKKGAQLRGFVITLLGGLPTAGDRISNKPTAWFPLADIRELADLVGWAATMMRDVAVELDKSMEVPPSFRHASALFAAPFWEEGWTMDGMGPISQNWAGHLTSMMNLQNDLLDVAHAGYPVESYR